MIKRTPSLTDQVKAHIKQQLLANEYDGDRIPSETDLAEELGVSRTTIRDALSRLEIEGAIYRKQGAGTFVNRPGLRIKSRLEEIWSYEAVLEAHGYEPSTRILDVRLQPAGLDLAAELAVEPDDRLVRAEKLFLEDEQPVILARNLIPEALITTPYQNDDLIVPVFEFLEKFAQQHLSYYLSEVVPVIASGTVAEALELSTPTALIAFEEIGYNEDNQPILKACSYFRDDLLRLRLIRRKS